MALTESLKHRMVNLDISVEDLKRQRRNYLFQANSVRRLHEMLRSESVVLFARELRILDDELDRIRRLVALADECIEYLTDLQSSADSVLAEALSNMKGQRS